MPPPSARASEARVADGLAAGLAGETGAEHGGAGVVEVRDGEGAAALEHEKGGLVEREDGAGEEIWRGGQAEGGAVAGLAVRVPVGAEREDDHVGRVGERDGLVEGGGRG